MRHYLVFLPLLSLLLTSQPVLAAPSDSLAFARVPDNVTSITVDHIAYTLSWNPDYNIPNWVAYCLTRNEAETKVVERDNRFRPDPDVKNSPVSDDYKKSGYDRGHIAPAADMRWDSTAMRECFYMTNMCPQLHSLNAGCWKTLEEDVRLLAIRYDSLYVCAGPVINPADTNAVYIGTKHKVLVPKQFFKALLVHSDNQWYAIAYIFNAEQDDISFHIENVDELEVLLGFDLFYNLPDDVENRVEATVNKGFWK